MRRITNIIVLRINLDLLILCLRYNINTIPIKILKIAPLADLRKLMSINNVISNITRFFPTLS